MTRSKLAQSQTNSKSLEIAPQPQLFNPDLEPIRYIAENGTFEFTLDGTFKTFWLTQKQIAEMYELDQSVVSRHIQNFKKDRPEDSVYAKYAYTESDGKTYQVEHYNHSVAIYIGYRAQATKKTIAFQRFFEETFRQRLETEHTRAILQAGRRRAQDVTAYILKGNIPQWAETRVDDKVAFKEIATHVVRLTGSGAIMGRVVNREYVELLGKTAQQLKEILHTKNVRDSLSLVQLNYLLLAETQLSMVLANIAHMTSDQLLNAVSICFGPLGQSYRHFCQMMGLDLVTQNKPLLKGGVS